MLTLLAASEKDDVFRWVRPIREFRSSRLTQRMIYSNRLKVMENGLFSRI